MYALFQQGVKLKHVEDRVEHVETKMGEFATTINDLVDASEEKDEEMEWVKAKIADIEDRNKRNNLKIRGIPQTSFTGSARPLCSQHVQSHSSRCF